MKVGERRRASPRKRGSDRVNKLDPDQVGYVTNSNSQRRYAPWVSGMTGLGGRFDRNTHHPPQVPVAQSRLFNRDGQVGGVAILDPNGRMGCQSFGQRGDATAGFSFVFILYAHHLKDEQRDIFAKWADFPAGPLDASQCETFALAVMHYCRSLKEAGLAGPKLLLDMFDSVPSVLPPLDKPLTDEVRQMFYSLFGGKKEDPGLSEK